MGHCCTPIKIPKVANFHINHTDDQLEVVLTNGQTFSVSKAELVEFLGDKVVSDVIVEDGELKVVSADGSKKTVAIPTATTTRNGVVMLATPAEVTAGTDNSKAVTPAGVKAATDRTLDDAKAYADQLASQNTPKPVPSATTTTAGIIEVATTTEATAGTDNSKAVTPAGVKAATDRTLDDAKAYADQLASQNTPKPVPSATTTTAGIIEVATTTEAKAGTSNTRAMTPATTKAVVDDALGSEANKATGTKLGTVKLGNRALANDGTSVLGYFVNV